MRQPTQLAFSDNLQTLDLAPFEVDAIILTEANEGRSLGFIGTPAFCNEEAQLFAVELIHRFNSYSALREALEKIANPNTHVLSTPREGAFLRNIARSAINKADSNR